MYYETKIFLALTPIFILLGIIALVIIYQFIKTKYVSRYLSSQYDKLEKENLIYKPVIVTV